MHLGKIYPFSSNQRLALENAYKSSVLLYEPTYLPNLCLKTTLAIVENYLSLTMNFDD